MRLARVVTVVVCGASVAALALAAGALAGLRAVAPQGGVAAHIEQAIGESRSARDLLGSQPGRAAVLLRAAASDLRAARAAPGVPAAAAAGLRQAVLGVERAATELAPARGAMTQAGRRLAFATVSVAISRATAALGLLRTAAAGTTGAATTPVATSASAPVGAGTLQWCAYTTLGGLFPLETFLLSDPAGAGQRASVNMVRGEANTFSTITLDAAGAGAVTYPVPGANYILVQIAELQTAGPPVVVVGSFYVDPLTVASAGTCTLHR